MPAKYSTVKRKKRRFCGNQYTKKRIIDPDLSATSGDDTHAELSPTENVSAGEGTSQSAILNTVTPPKREESASARKLSAGNKGFSSSKEDSGVDIVESNGFRLVDISILASMINLLLCLIGCNSKVCLKEDEQVIIGFVTHLKLCSSNSKCLFEETFSTSKRIS